MYNTNHTAEPKDIIEKIKFTPEQIAALEEIQKLQDDDEVGAEIIAAEELAEIYAELDFEAEFWIVLP